MPAVGSEWEILCITGYGWLDSNIKLLKCNESQLWDWPQSCAGLQMILFTSFKLEFKILVFHVFKIRIYIQVYVIKN